MLHTECTCTGQGDLELWAAGSVLEHNNELAHCVA